MGKSRSERSKRFISGQVFLLALILNFFKWGNFNPPGYIPFKVQNAERFLMYVVSVDLNVEKLRPIRLS